MSQVAALAILVRIGKTALASVGLSDFTQRHAIDCFALAGEVTRLIVAI
jgi:hypothetical protein